MFEALKNQKSISHRCYVFHQKNIKRRFFEEGHLYYIKNYFDLYIENPISGVMVSMLALSVVDQGFETSSDHTKNYQIGISCFSQNSDVREKTGSMSN